MANTRKINILTPDVYNKIAAGEVVERPASALKELVENAIDAGARRIVIEVENGGFDLISVSDNGCGIYEDDLDAVFIKHATSKLQTADDLDLIQTLGFRGEALSSIAAVSRVKLTTRQAQSDAGVSVTVEDGKVSAKQYVTANVGTKIEVRDLFYNTPARKKFMKTGSREGTDITKYVSKLVLTNPNLEMTYILDGKTVYQTKGSGLSEAIFAVYGSECLANCLPVSYATDVVRIEGYIGTPEYAKPNSTYQTLSVNGRCVQDKSVQGAISQAFKPFLMTRQYPFFVLDLSIPFDMVDVNVHPRKSEVRFQNAQMVCGKFFRAVENALNEYKAARTQQIWGAVEEPNDDLDEIKYDDNYAFKSTLLNGITEMTGAQVEDILAITEQTRKQNQMSFDEFAEEMERTISVKKARQQLGLDDEEESVQQEKTLSIPQEPPAAPRKPDLGELLLARARVLGTAFKTYVIVQLDEKLILIDQHAAHERILFDKFMERKSSDMQEVLFPYVFTVKDDEADFINRNLENILQAGIEVEPFGVNTYRIRSVATLLADMEMRDFVKYILESAEELQIDDRTLVVEKIAKKACKAAVKAGEALSETDIQFILKAVYENNILQCPHGRPITTVFTKTQLEKMFKRIV